MLVIYYLMVSYLSRFSVLIFSPSSFSRYFYISTLISPSAPVICSAGRFAAPGSTSCTFCRPGYYCPSAATSIMSNCTSGTYSIGTITNNLRMLCFMNGVSIRIRLLWKIRGNQEIITIDNNLLCICV